MSLPPPPVRPALTTRLTVAEFDDWYWTLAELQQLCRTAGLPASGRKAQVSARVRAFLGGSESVTRVGTSTRAPRGQMPQVFHPELVVQPGWWCSEQLRDYLRARLGSSFTFTRAVREFIAADGVGRPLVEVEQVWRASRTHRPRSSGDIEAVFEYNRFRHDFRAAHPDAGRAQIDRAWRIWRDTPVSARPPIARAEP